jgi:murein DD-endopeptidase MepM/ murein hydrolase activator NlpD
MRAGFSAIKNLAVRMFSVRSVRTVLLMLALTPVMLLRPGDVTASHDSYQFKWPYHPGETHPTTRHPFENGHGNAWDMVIGDNEVVASAEGTVIAAASLYDPNSCDPEDGGGFGNYVQVRTSTAQGQRTLTYAHLASTRAVQGSRVLQGDRVGIQGKTGHTRGSEPPNNCGTHLHFQFNPSRPPTIDGQDVTSDSVDVGNSTNAVVGNFSEPGAAIRAKYYGLGAVFPSWSVVGWAVDPTGSNLGCPANSYCRLYTHASPNVVTGHWGAQQTFRVHPDAQGFRDSSLQVGRWAVNDAYWVRPAFYFGQRLSSPHIGLAIHDQIGQFPGLCNAELTCLLYQRFHLGYAWISSAYGVVTRYCPDIAPFELLDYAVTTGDLAAVVENFGQIDDRPLYAPWPAAWYDVDGDGAIAISDLLLVVSTYGELCYPT